MTKSVLVIGAHGQDGSYLCEQLAADGAAVSALTRAGLMAPGAGDTTPLSLADGAAMRRMIRDGSFDEIYYLAAYHHSSEDQRGSIGDLVRSSLAVHVDGLLNVLDAMAAVAPKARLFYAASSHIFGVADGSPQTEETPLRPICAYGITKSAGVELCRLFRQEHGIFASVGILYNHESPRRGPNFLSRKVARAVVEIDRGARAELVLADLDARTDWGYAPEYVDAMRRILALEQPGDFVISSGRAESVREFVAAAFGRIGLDWTKHVRVDRALDRKSKRGLLVGNPDKVARLTGWSARTSAQDLARLMVDAERSV
jgi:GDPmannose 4,6-dehydratase